MKKKIQFFTFIILAIHLIAIEAYAGNPDRQGEAGAYELLLNPWAKSAGLHSINTSNVSGVDAMRINVAGLSNEANTEVVIGSALYLKGTDIQMNALGLSQKIGENGTLGLSIMALDFGEIPVTTESQPEGTGATFSPSFINIGLGYSHTFANKVSVGVLARIVNESLSNVNATGVAFDMGIQYVSGKDDNFKLGVSLRNIGGSLQFNGQGLSREVRVEGNDYPINFQTTANKFELPSMLNIGLSYDVDLNEEHELTFLGNFTSNSFSEDNFGIGLIYSMRKMFSLRAAYKYTMNQYSNVETAPIYTGLAVGASVQVPLKKGSERKLSFDYAYRTTREFDGTHNFALRINL